jgi:hypothetical protein
MKLTALVWLCEFVILSAMAGLVLLVLNIPFAKAGPFSIIMLSAIGFSFICVVQFYSNFIGKFEPPLGTQMVRLFVKKYQPRPKLLGRGKI